MLFYIILIIIIYIVLLLMIFCGLFCYVNFHFNTNNQGERFLFTFDNNITFTLRNEIAILYSFGLY